MALAEGTGSSGGSSPAGKPRGGSTSSPGRTRLQAFTGDIVRKEAEEETPAPAPDYSTLLAAYGTAAQPPAPGTVAHSLSTGYALARGEAAPEPEVVGTTTETVEKPEPEPEEKTYRARKTKELSWDDYLGLTERQRAAVDFNTMLVQARQKDLRNQDEYEPNEAQRETYDKAVERMFGETGTSDTFAPETVALLNQIDYQGTEQRRGDDLDDFLGLAAAITAKDIKKMGVTIDAPLVSEEQAQQRADVAQMLAPPTATTGADFAVNLAASTQNLQQALVQGNQVLENFKKVAMTARNEELHFLGGESNKLTTPDPRLPGGVDESYFAQAYAALADANTDPKVADLIRSDLGPGGPLEGQLKDFLRYADTKSKYAAQYDTGLGGDPTVQYRSPQEFRQILGLNKGGDGDGRG